MKKDKEVEHLKSVSKKVSRLNRKIRPRSVVFEDKTKYKRSREKQKQRKDSIL